MSQQGHNFLDSAGLSASFSTPPTSTHPRLYCSKAVSQLSHQTIPSMPVTLLILSPFHRRPFCHLVIPVHTYPSRLSSNNNFPKTLPWNLQKQILTHPCPCSPQCTLLLQLLAHTMSSLFAGTCHCSPVIAITRNRYFCPFPLCASSTHNLASLPAFEFSNGFLFICRRKRNCNSLAGLCFGS